MPSTAPAESSCGSTIRETWKLNPAQDGLRASRANRGVAYADGRIYVAARDGRLIALDAKTGSRLWSVETVDPDTPEQTSPARRASSTAR